LDVDCVLSTTTAWHMSDVAQVVT